MIIPISQIAKGSIFQAYQLSSRLCSLGGRAYFIPRRSTFQWPSRASQLSTKTTADLEESNDESYLGPALPEANDLATRKDRTEYRRQKWSGPPSPSAEAVSLALRQGASPTAALKNHLEDAEEIDTHVLSVCARGLWDQIGQRQRRERATLLNPLKEQGLARQLLLRIWEHRKSWESMVFRENDFCHLLCYLAVNEGLESHIKAWLGVEVSNVDHEGHWRGMLLRNLVFAHLHHDIDYKADAALTCLLDVSKRKSAAVQDYYSKLKSQPDTPKPPLAVCSLSPAIIELKSSICGRRGLPNTNVELYQRFLDLVRSYWKRRLTSDDAQTIARLELYHPGVPREASALALLRKQHEYGVDDGSIVQSMSHPSSVESFRRFVQKTIAVARLNGNTEEADWVQKVYGQHAEPAPLVRKIGISRMRS